MGNYKRTKKIHITQDDVVSYEEFAFWLKNIRRTLGMTQQEFSDHLGFPVTTIRQYENGKSAPQDPFIFVEQVKGLLKTKRM